MFTWPRDRTVQTRVSPPEVFAIKSPGFLVSISLRPPNLENWFRCFYLCACNSASTSSGSFSAGMQQCFVIRSLKLANWLETDDEPALRVEKPQEIPLTSQSEMGCVRYRRHRQFLGLGLISIESLPGTCGSGAELVRGNSFNICLTSRVGAHIPEHEGVEIWPSAARARGRS